MIKKVLGSVLLTLSLMANDVVVDPETGLMWQDSSTIVSKSWSSAKNYCSELILKGQSDWRLPHIDELMSITDRSKYNPAIKSIFKHTKSSWYWSSTEYKDNSSKAWLVSFSNGNGNYYAKSDDYYVRCVRGGRQ